MGDRLLQVQPSKKPVRKSGLAAMKERNTDAKRKQRFQQHEAWKQGGERKRNIRRRTGPGARAQRDDVSAASSEEEEEEEEEEEAETEEETEQASDLASSEEEASEAASSGEEAGGAPAAETSSDRGHRGQGEQGSPPATGAAAATRTDAAAQGTHNKRSGVRGSAGLQLAETVRFERFSKRWPAAAEGQGAEDHPQGVGGGEEGADDGSEAAQAQAAAEEAACSGVRGSGGLHLAESARFELFVKESAAALSTGTEPSPPPPSSATTTTTTALHGSGVRGSGGLHLAETARFTRFAVEDEPAEPGAEDGPALWDFEGDPIISPGAVPEETGVDDDETTGGAPASKRMWGDTSSESDRSGNGTREPDDDQEDTYEEYVGWLGGA